MIITKIGHSCLVIEHEGTKILTDPGVFSTAQNDVTGIHAILLTHEHPDHLNIDSLKIILEKNPGARVITNTGVGQKLTEASVPFETVEAGQSADVNGTSIEGFGQLHALMYTGVPQVANTCYFVAGKLFLPGDSFTVPSKEVEILALPVGGPWLKLAEAIDYAKTVRPKTAFPIHDGIFKSQLGILYTLPEQELAKSTIGFVTMHENDTHTF